MSISFICIEQVYKGSQTSATIHYSKCCIYFLSHSFLNLVYAWCGNTGHLLHSEQSCHGMSQLQLKSNVMVCEVLNYDLLGWTNAWPRDANPIAKKRKQGKPNWCPPLSPQIKTKFKPLITIYKDKKITINVKPFIANPKAKLMLKMLS
jgi:hypothetical protein